MTGQSTTVRQLHEVIRLGKMGKAIEIAQELLGRHRIDDDGLIEVGH